VAAAAASPSPSRWGALLPDAGVGDRFQRFLADQEERDVVPGPSLKGHSNGPVAGIGWLCVETNIRARNFSQLTDFFSL